MMALRDSSLDSIFRYFIFFSFFGIYPFRYYNRNVLFSPCLFLFNFFFIAFISLILGLHNVMDTDREIPMASRSLHLFSVMLAMLVSVITFFQLSCKRQVLSDLTINLFKLEYYTNSSISFLLPLYYIGFFQIILIIAQFYMNFVDFYFFYQITFLQHLLFAFQFSIILIALRSQLKGLTTLLDNNVNKSKILPILEHHNIILNCNSALNNLFGLQIMLSLLGQFLQLVCLSQEHFPTALKGEARSFFQFLIFIASPSLVTSFLVLNCHSIAVEDEIFTSTLRQSAINRALDDPNLIIINIHLSRFQPLKISAGGFFDVNASVLVNMVAALASYIMLVSQWTQYS